MSNKNNIDDPLKHKISKNFVLQCFCGNPEYEK